jgi:hypothetical protein
MKLMAEPQALFSLVAPTVLSRQVLASLGAPEEPRVLRRAEPCAAELEWSP